MISPPRRGRPLILGHDFVLWCPRRPPLETDLEHVGLVGLEAGDDVPAPGAERPRAPCPVSSWGVQCCKQALLGDRDGGAVASLEILGRLPKI